MQRYFTIIRVECGVKKLTLQCKTQVNYFGLSGQNDQSEIRAEFFKDKQGVRIILK